MWIDFIFRSRPFFPANSIRHIQESIKSMNGLDSASLMHQTVSFSRPWICKSDLPPVHTEMQPEVVQHRSV